MLVNRREVLRHGVAAMAAFGLARLSDGAEPLAPRLPRERFGTLMLSYGIRARHEPGFDRPERFAAFAREQGFGGVQISLKVRPTDECRELREQLAKVGGYVEGIVSPPKDQADLERFEAEMRTAGECGASVVRTVMMGGRRYEVFKSADEYKAFKERAWRSLQLAEPVAARRRVRLAVENHKDYRADELADVMRRLSSEHVGVRLDTGNNLALLEDAWQVVDTLAPWTATVHLKDMAVEESADGFLLSEVPLGAGFLDLPRIIERITRANPAARFNLEMITRDPLSIPCFSDGYWATLADMPAASLARAMRTVKQHALASGKLPRISGLSAAEQIAREHAHASQSVAGMKGMLT